MLDELVQQLTASAVESVAICFLHSYLNPTHEQQVAQALEAVRGSDDKPRFFVCRSSDVLPEYREYERTSTTVVNAYVAPVLDRYLGRLEDELAAQGVGALRIMASDGGSMTARAARRLAARTTLSGPAGGVVGARAVAEQAGFDHIISFDMGGTSTDVALCAGTLPQTSASQVGGLPVRLPSIDIHTVGAGGGSLARIDAGGHCASGRRAPGQTLARPAMGTAHCPP
jgi:N-methylhydantoinase A